MRLHLKLPSSFDQNSRMFGPRIQTGHEYFLKTIPTLWKSEEEKNFNNELRSTSKEIHRAAQGD